MIFRSTKMQPGENDHYNIKIENVLSDDCAPEILITVNSWMDHAGGSDGEDIQLTRDEFEEFIGICQEALNRLGE